MNATQSQYIYIYKKIALISEYSGSGDYAELLYRTIMV